MNEETFLLDLGSGTTKVGVASQSEPHLMVPSAYGLPRIKLDNGNPQDRILYGEDLREYSGAILREDLLPFSQPKDDAAIFNFIHYVFRSISLPTRNVGLVLAVSPEWTNDFLYQLQTHLFQKYDFSSILPIRKDLLALICHRIKTGIVLDVGYYQSKVHQFTNG
ncbi:MAG: hypothetical protein KAR20_11130, partial [Candidatus Heimdallarchaeota archaeon]|nr:hypothetical protein [Candidatus Heimdallarchaeota archaeon]